jgi:hypothetical protein
MVKTRSGSSAQTMTTTDDTIKPVDAPSAISGVTVPEVRRALDALRTAWNNPSPFYVSAPLSFEGTEKSRMKRKQQVQSPGGETMESFCIKYVMGHHVKRHGRSKHAA